MPAAANLDWLYHTLGYALAAAGLLLLLWSLFWDRPRGRRRCPKCWYDMAGVPGIRCPECGREARRERSLFKTHRRRRGVCLAILLMLAASPVWSVPRIRRDGWFGAVPTTILALTVPMGGREWEQAHTPDWRVLVAPNGSWLARTLQRIETERPWGWQSQVFHDRLFRSHPGEILNMLGVPKRWPIGVPLRLRLNPGYGGYRDDTTTVRVRLRGDPKWAEGSASFIDAALPDPGCLGTPSAGTDTTRFDVELRDARGRLWRGVLTPHLRGDGTMGDYMRAVAVPDMAETIESRRPRIEWMNDGRALLILNNNFDAKGWDCTFAVDVDLIRNGKPVGRTRLFRFNVSALGVFTGHWPDTLYGPIEWYDTTDRPKLDQSLWEARFTPNESLAMLDYIADAKSRDYNPGVNTYWKGDLTVPIGSRRYQPTGE